MKQEFQTCLKVTIIFDSGAQIVLPPMEKFEYNTSSEKTTISWQTKLPNSSFSFCNKLSSINFVLVEKVGFNGKGFCDD